MKLKNTLNSEQSQRLIDLGVDPKLASEVLVDYIDPYDLDDAIERKRPIFTLTDLISILPKEIEGTIFSCPLNIEWSISTKEWKCNYDTQTRYFFAPELIDALYQLLVFVLENDLNPKSE